MVMVAPLVEVLRQQSMEQLLQFMAIFPIKLVQILPPRLVLVLEQPKQYHHLIVIPLVVLM